MSILLNHLHLERSIKYLKATETELSACMRLDNILLVIELTNDPDFDLAQYIKHCPKTFIATYESLCMSIEKRMEAYDLSTEVTIAVFLRDRIKAILMLNNILNPFSLN
jgi:hypothetical protein